jgi:hypothetical protein
MRADMRVDQNGAGEGLLRGGREQGTLHTNDANVPFGGNETARVAEVKD